MSKLYKNMMKILLDIMPQHLIRTEIRRIIKLN